MSIVAADAVPAVTATAQVSDSDAALANVKTFALNGSLSRNFGERTLQSEVEMICELPDKCLRVLVKLLEFWDSFCKQLCNNGGRNVWR